MAGGQTGFFQEAKTKLYSVVSCNSGIKLFICATKVSRYLCIFHNYCQFYFHSWYSYIFVSVLVFFVSGFGWAVRIAMKENVNRDVIRTAIIVIRFGIAAVVIIIVL